MQVGMAVHLPEPGSRARGPRGLQERAPARRSRRAARLSVHLGRRAPLHRLHHVPRRAAVPLLHGGAHHARVARLDGGGAALARSDARRRGSVDARQPVRRPPHPGPRPRRGQGRVRRLPAVHGRVAPALRRDGADAAGGPRARLLRVRRRVRPAAARRHPAGAVQVLPRPHLCGGGLAGVGAHHGRAGRGHPDHSPEALARGRQGARGLSRDLPRGERRRGARADLRGLDVLRPQRRAGARDGATGTSAATSRASSPTITSRAITSAGPRATSTTARWPRRSRRTAPTR